MKILRVITSMNPSQGGPGQGIRNSIPALQELGCENEVVCLDPPLDTADENHGIPIYALGAARGPWRSNPRLRPWLDANLKNYDAVIVHGLWEYHSFAVTKAALRLRRLAAGTAPGVFVMPHGMLDPWFQRDPSRRVKAVRNSIYWHLLEKRTIAQADAVFFTCQRELELAQTTFNCYRPKREINTGYGVAPPPPRHQAMLNAFSNACPAIERRDYLLYLSRIHPKKGVDLLLDVYATEMRRRGVDAMPDLVIAGPLDSPYAERMMEIADRLMSDIAVGAGSTAKKIHFPGMLQGDAKWGAFYGCQAFVLPSHQENFGIAVVEALACAKPVLISDQVNICDEISEAGAGIICPDTQSGVQSGLARLLALTQSGTGLMSERAIACYNDNFRPATAAQRLIQAMRDCDIRD